MNITNEQLLKMKNDLLNGLADGSIKTVECSTHQEYLELMYGKIHL